MSGYRGCGRSRRAHKAKARRRGRVLGAGSTLRHPINPGRSKTVVFASVVAAAVGFVGLPSAAPPTRPAWAGGVVLANADADYFPTFPVPDFPTGIFPDFPADVFTPTGNVGTNDIGSGNTGDLDIGDGNNGSGNIGSGNIGSNDFGSGNFGSDDVGSGNSGSDDVGLGNGGGNGDIGWSNQGSDDFGFGNFGSSDIGFGNTGDNDFGFGNTGSNDFGIGCTGDDEVGFCGLNSGTGNNGLFNSGTDNSGFGNSGSDNTGIGNSGSDNIGYGNTGIDNEGVGSSGENNVGSYDAGIGNIGDDNSGNSNIGIGNSVVDNSTNDGNPGDGNTDLTNGNYTESVPNPDASADGISTVPVESQGIAIQYTVPVNPTDPSQDLQVIDTTTVTATSTTVETTTVAPLTIDGSTTLAQDLSQNTSICASVVDGCGGEPVQVTSAPTTPGDDQTLFEPIDGHNDLGMCVLPGGCDIAPIVEPSGVTYAGDDIPATLTSPIASILDAGQAEFTSLVGGAVQGLGLTGTVAGEVIAYFIEYFAPVAEALW
jgi:Pentapeptide repeats (8 copies)